MWEAIQEVPWLGPVLAAVILASYFMYRREVSAVARQLERQALKRGGQVRYPWFHYPRLTLRDGGMEITVSAMYGTEHGGPSTFTDFSMAGLKPYGFRIDPHGSPPRRSPYRAARTGNVTFDEAFLVHAGEGGMATVYLADDLKHERKVALKVLKLESAAVVGAERFLAEIKTTANLQHPHILPTRGTYKLHFNALVARPSGTDAVAAGGGA